MPILDSGAVSMFRPAMHQKPTSLLQRFGNQIEAIRGRHVMPAVTSQQGTAAASPATYRQTLWPQRFEKAQYIGDNWNQWYNDPACRKACNMYVFEAVRGGVRVQVQEGGSMQKDAQEIANVYCKKWPVHGGPEDGISLMGAGLCAMIAGEFWPQAAFRGSETDGYVDHFLNMPAVGMERNTDDADQFVDPLKAYSQVDTASWGEIATFPKYLVYNARWNWMPGAKNGNPEIISVRRLARLLELMEACKITQVQVRSSLRYVYYYGTQENPASPDEVRDLMALNGFVEGKREIFDPAEGARDIHMTGVGDVKALEGDQGVGAIDHLKYFLDRTCTGYPTPRALMNLGAENVNRDVLQDMRAQWMADTVRVNQFIDGPFKYFLEIQWLLQGIDPAQIKYETLWTKSTTATEEEQILWHINLVNAGMESRETAMENLQEFIRFKDVKVEMARIEKESEHAAQLEEKKLKRLDVLGIAGTKTEPKKPNVAGKSNGHANLDTRN